MPERTTLTQVVQFGVESTPGTGVPCVKRFKAIDIETKVENVTDAFRPSGFKFTTVTTENKEWTSASVKGQPTYTEIVYPLASVIVTPANPTEFLDTAIHTGVYKWIFEPSTTAPDTLTTYSMEQGSSVRAHRFTNGVFTEFGFNISRDKTELSGKMLGQILIDGTRSDASCGTTNASPTVTDTAVTQADVGRPVSGTNIPANAYIASVVTGTSFTMAVTGGGSPNATGTGTVTVTVGGLSVLSPSTNITAGITSGSPTMTYATAALSDVGRSVSGTGITAGTKIIAVSVGVSATLSANATATNASASITLGAPTIDLIPIASDEGTVYFDQLSANLGTTKLGRLFDFKFSLQNRIGPFWVIDASVPSFAGTVEIVPKVQIKLMVEADANGMALLSRLRDNATWFMRVLSQGATLYSAGVYAGAAALKYQFQGDFACQVVEAGQLQDHEGVYAIEFTLEVVHDDGWGKAMHIEIQNKQATL